MGLGLKTGKGVWSLCINRGYQHGITLVPWIETVCRDAGVLPGDLDLVVAATGPGSFTGLRIGLATAKGLASGAVCPFRGVPTLDAMAWRFHHHTGFVVPIMDARKGHVYAAVFKDGERQSEYLDCPPKELADSIIRLSGSSSPTLFTGPHAVEFCRHAMGSDSHPFLADSHSDLSQPLALLERGLLLYQVEGGSEKTLAPMYLRKSEAELNLEKRA